MPENILIMFRLGVLLSGVLNSYSFCWCNDNYFSSGC